MRTIAITLLLAAPCFAIAAPAEPAVADFAWTMNIGIKTGEGLYVATLPLAVYGGTESRNLGDLRVFNGAGETVPYSLLSPPATGAQKPAASTVAIFPLWAQAGTPAGALTVRVEQSANGAIVGVKGAEKSRLQPRLAGYIVDTSNFDKPLQAIVIDWETGAPKTLEAGAAANAEHGFAGHVDVESSDDLKHWAMRVAAAPLITLQHDGQSLRVNRVELPRFTAKYLRLSWPASQSTPPFTGVQAEPVDVAIDMPRTWHTVTAVAGAKPGEYLCDMEAHAPFDRLRLELPNPNTVATVQLLGRSGAEEPWRPVVAPTVYRLTRNGQDLVSPDIGIAPLAVRYWLLRLDSRTSIGQGTPRLSAGFVPQKIVFAARGVEPFELAYGAQGVASASIPIATLVPGYRDDKPLAAAAAVLSDARMHDSATKRPPRWMDWARLEWKKIILWSVLVLGAGMLGWMALRLSRNINAG